MVRIPRVGWLAISMMCVLTVAGCTSGTGAGPSGPAADDGSDPGTDPGGAMTGDGSGAAGGSGDGSTGGGDTDSAGGGDSSGDVPGASGDGEPTGEDDATMGNDIDDTLTDDGPAFNYEPGNCGLDTGYAGDDACLLPPDPEVGMQFHIGPEEYTEEAIAEFILEPGGEETPCYYKKTPNTEEYPWSGYVLSGRPGTHHIINTIVEAPRADGWAAGCGLGDSASTFPGTSRPYVPLPPTAPENEGVGSFLPAQSQIASQMHYFNATSEPIIREYWVNLYYKDPDTITQSTSPIRGLGGFGWQIPVGAHENYRYACDFQGDGRVLMLLGHTHAHGDRFTAWIERSGELTKVFEQFDYTEPQLFYYNSETVNPDFNPEAKLPGATSGMIEVQDGDRLVWECEVNNDSMYPLDYSCRVDRGEMCNVWGSTVGTTVDCLCWNIGAAVDSENCAP